MRVASMMMTNRYLKQLNRTYEAQTKLMEQSDGDKLHRASDDAIGYSKYLRYGDSFAENNQYQTNVKSAISWMKNSDAAVQDISDALKTIVEKSNAAQDTNTTTDMQAIAKEMLVKVQQVVADGNMQVNGRYLFSGQSDLKQPYSMSNDKFQRGLTKNLDDKQTAFFNQGTAPSKTASSGNLSQMLTLKGSDGNEYYLNTMDGKVYSKDFMDNGYKDKMAAGQATVKAGDEAGTASGWGGSTDVSKYFDANGVINTAGESFSSNITVGGQNVTLKFSTIEQYIITYSGDNNHFSMVKENGATQPATDTVNMNGIDLAGTSIFDDANSGNRSSGAAAFNDVLTVVAMTDMGNAAWMSSDGKTLANNSFEIVNTSQSKLAARQQVYTDCQNMLTTQNESILTDITEVHSTDVAKLATKLMEAQTIYQLSLSVGSRILPPTLADYL
ncbi:MAG: hypothetical protein II487_06485 [Schwartzia sp.]|nr:hypothetical protein [Schwartzia sp. (in: firmicutes)]